MSEVSGWQLAKLKWFDRTKGFGFLTRGEGTDDILIFVHVFRDARINDPQPGQQLMVRTHPRVNRGEMAREVATVASVTMVEGAAAIWRSRAAAGGDAQCAAAAAASRRDIG